MAEPKPKVFEYEVAFDGRRVVTARNVATGGASTNPKLTAAWFSAFPSARSGGFKY